MGTGLVVQEGKMQLRTFSGEVVYPGGEWQSLRRASGFSHCGLRVAAVFLVSKDSEWEA